MVRGTYGDRSTSHPTSPFTSNIMARAERLSVAGQALAEVLAASTRVPDDPSAPAAIPSSAASVAALIHTDRPQIGLLVEQACRALDTQHAFTLLSSVDETDLEVCSAYGAFESLRHARIRRGEGPLGRVWNSGRMLITGELSTWAPELPGVNTHLLSTIVCTPLIRDSRVIGLIGFGFDKSSPALNPERIELIEAVSRRAASDHGRNLSDLRRKQEREHLLVNGDQPSASFASMRDQLSGQIGDRNAHLHRQNGLLSALHEITLQLLNETDLEPLLESVMLLARQLLGAAHAWVALVTPDGKAMRDIAGSALENGWSISSARGEGLKGRVWNSGCIEVLDDYSTWPGRMPDSTLHTLHATIVAPLKSNGQVIGTLGLAHTDPQLRFGKDEIDIVSRLVELAALAYDRARLLQSERRSRQVAESLRDVIRIVNSNRSLGEMLNFILEQAVQLLGASHGVLFRMNPQSHALTIQSTYGIDDPNLASFSIIVPPGTLARGRRYLADGLVLPSNVSNVLIAGIRRDPKLRAKFGILAENFGNAITAQLAIDDEIYGGIMLYGACASGYSQADRQVMQTLATHASLAIENARLHIQAVAAAAEEERSRLARDLHDSVSQALFGIGMGIHTALQLSDSNPAAVKEPLNYALSLSQAALAEMRALIMQLRPDLLEQHGLRGVLHMQAEVLRARHNMRVDTLIDANEPEVEDELKEAIYRVVTEALHNVVKHAHARRAAMTMTVHDGLCRVTVADDGVGFDTSQRFPSHFGLRIMRERMENLGGQMRIDSSTDSDNHGTTITISAPLRG